jgi:hypothetical protein
MSRPPTSLMRSKYPALTEFRVALKEWCRDRKSLQEAAADLCCTYRELSNYRHGHRWPPDRLVLMFGFKPEELREKHRQSIKLAKVFKKSKQADRVVETAVEFVTAVRSNARESEQRHSLNQFFASVTDYLKADKSRSIHA